MSSTFNLEETDKLLTTTRAVRKRLDLERPVERQVLLDCIGISQQAPTGSNTQFWRWMVIGYRPNKWVVLSRFPSDDQWLKRESRWTVRRRC